MTEQTNYEKATVWSNSAEGNEKDDAGLILANANAFALLAIADELRALGEHLTGERERKLAVGRFHKGLA